MLDVGRARVAVLLDRVSLRLPTNNSRPRGPALPRAEGLGTPTSCRTAGDVSTYGRRYRIRLGRMGRWWIREAVLLFFHRVIAARRSGGRAEFSGVVVAHVIVMDDGLPPCQHIVVVHGHG